MFVYTMDCTYGYLKKSGLTVIVGDYGCAAINDTVNDDDLIRIRRVQRIDRGGVVKISDNAILDNVKVYADNGKELPFSFQVNGRKFDYRDCTTFPSNLREVSSKRESIIKHDDKYANYGQFGRWYNGECGVVTDAAEFPAYIEYDEVNVVKMENGKGYVSYS